MLLEDVDVREVRLHVPVRDRAREPDLRRPVVEPDDAHGLYRKLGFVDPGSTMLERPRRNA